MLSIKPIQPGDTVTDQQVERIFNGLLSRTLPRNEWTHGAHLCAGTAVLFQHGLENAESVMPGLIRQYNESIGIRNSDESGYHHTITLFYLRAIDHLLSGKWDNGIGELATVVLNSEVAEPGFPFRFYTKELLFSTQARFNWVEGDLSG